MYIITVQLYTFHKGVYTASANLDIKEIIPY